MNPVSRYSAKLSAGTPSSSNSSVVAAGPMPIILVDQASRDLETTHKRTRLSRTDIVNRAVSLYEFVDAQISAGAEFIIRRDGQDYLVKLL